MAGNFPIVVAVHVVPAVTTATAAGVWIVRAVRRPAPVGDPGPRPPDAVTGARITALAAVTMAAACLVTLLAIYSYGPVQYYRAIYIVGLLFLVPAIGWRLVRLVRPGPAGTDRLATAATLVTGAVLLLTASILSALTNITLGFLVSGALCVVGGAFWLQERRP